MQHFLEESRVRLDFLGSIAPNPAGDIWASPFVRDEGGGMRDEGGGMRDEEGLA